jgi:NAD(P)-dependent dehydrogenase (short-subunit alcohol dehydrogenase family)
MAGQTVLVTGASRGLGAATARLAAQLGANIVLTARSRDDLQAVAQEIEAAGGQALIVVGDVSVPADCQRMVSEAIEAFAGLDAVVNNAGVLTPIAPVADVDIEAVRQNWMVNVLGPFMVAQAALPYLRQRNGRILNVSSGAAVSVTSGWAAYCMAKAAINHFTRSLAEEEPKITAIAFRPGAVDTAMQATIRRLGAKGMPGEDYAHFVDYHEEGRLLPPEVPGCALAVLALHARPEWSGSFLAWNNEDVQSLVRRFACASGS